MPKINFRTILIGIGIVFGLGVLGFGGWMIAITQGLPSAKELANYEPPITSRVHAGDGRLVAEFANQHRVYVPSEELPQQLIHAFVSAEDKSFFEHSGVDYWGVIRGTLGNALRGRRIAGGSTITQQVVKNMLVGSDRSITRKAREMILAGRIEKEFTKSQILELYLNEIYLGGRSYGVGAASLNYFGKSLGQLSLAECAMLASLPQAPSKVNPYNNPEAAVTRRNWVIDRMVINGYIEKAAAETAKAEKLTTVQRLDTDEIQASAYFVEEVRREILKLGKEKKVQGFSNEKEATKGFYEGGLSIRSTLDTNLQLVAQTALRGGLETYDRYYSGWRGPVTTLKSTDDFETQLTEYVGTKDGKKSIAGAGINWQLAVVTATGATAKLGLQDGNKGTLAAEDVKFAAAFKRGKQTGLQVGDVILVSRQAAADLTTQVITEYAAPVKFSDNSPWHLRQMPQVEGAMVAIDPHTGRVLAMAGGYSFGRSQYNRVTQAMRQPGSSFKPFVYAAALEQKEGDVYKWTPASRILDAPYVSCADQTQEKCYKPSNYEEDYYGLATLRLGVEKSRNAMTVRLASDMGLEKVSEMGERMGIYDKLPPYQAMALGAGETTPLRMATAYAELVNGGKQVKPVLLDRIQNRYGKSIFKRDERPCTTCSELWKDGLQPPTFEDTRKQVMDPVTAYQIVSILEGVVQRGTGGQLLKVGKPIGAKTGTSNDEVDAWTVAASPDLVVAVWMGFDQPKKMGRGATGGRMASPMARDFMMVALKDTPALPFRVPQGVRLVEIDADSGCLPQPNSRLVILESFKPGSEPTETCAVGGSTAEGAYKVDFSRVIAGDESVGVNEPLPGAAPVDPAVPVSADPNAPVDPNAPAATPTPKEDLTLKDGIF